MFSYFILLKKGKKGQIFPILIVIAVILIIAALISANLGKVSLDRLYCIQGADAGAIAGVSDFTCGYNKAHLAHIAMLAVSVVIQTYLAIPLCINCVQSRAAWALAAGMFNRRVYEWADAMVRGYSEAARKDAYYHAFINAGIDDKYKYDAGQYRDKPHLNETWEHWTSLKSAFSKWLNDLPDGWGNASSLTYRWTGQNGPETGDKSVTVNCESSPPEDLGYQAWALIGIYCIVITVSYVTFCIYVPIPHPPIPFHAFLHSPSQKWVRITIQRNYQEETKNLGFWSVRHPETQATARVRMTGSISSGFDFELEE